MGEECIKLVKDAKLLGVTIYSDLTWNAHITEVTKKAAKRLYFLVQLKRALVPQKDLRLFYITCVPSVIDYASQVFHNTLPAYPSQELERVQKRAMRIICPGIEYQQALALMSLPTVAVISHYCRGNNIYIIIPLISFRGFFFFVKTCFFLLLLFFFLMFNVFLLIGRFFQYVTIKLQNSFI